MNKEISIKNYRFKKSVYKILESALIFGGTFLINSVLSLTVKSPEVVNYVFYLLRGLLLGNIVLESINLSKDIVMNSQYKSILEIENDSEKDNDYSYGYEYGYEKEYKPEPVLIEQEASKTQEVGFRSHYIATRGSAILQGKQSPEVQKTLVPVVDIKGGQ